MIWSKLDIELDVRYKVSNDLLGIENRGRWVLNQDWNRDMDLISFKKVESQTSTFLYFINSYKLLSYLEKNFGFR